MKPLSAAIEKLDTLDLDDLTRHTIEALMNGYAETYANEQWQAVAVEQEFRLPIQNPDAKRVSSSRTYDHAGKLDLVVESPSRPGYYLMDHKTTSEDISPGNDFWKRLFLATQPSHYQLACWQAGIELAGCVWDVIRKPTIRPRKLTKADREEITKGTYCGISIPDDYLADTEDARLYGIRVLADIREQPGKYFQRQIVPRSEREMLEFARDLFGTASLIRRSSSEGKFYRTGATHACMMYGKACEYLDLCCGFSNEGDGRYAQIPVHEELTDVTAEPESVLTNSSLTTYRQCQRKYEYRYVKQIGLAKSHDESFYFGSAMHSALEAYWKQHLAPETRRLGCLFERSTDGNGNGERSPGTRKESLLARCDSIPQG